MISRILRGSLPILKKANYQFSATQKLASLKASDLLVKSNLLSSTDTSDPTKHKRFRCSKFYKSTPFKNSYNKLSLQPLEILIACKTMPSDHRFLSISFWIR